MYDSTTYSIPHKWLRPVSTGFDQIVYFLLSIVFQIFFNITNATIFDNTVIYQFYNRIQLLIGIYVTFKISFSIISGIVAPDQATDTKKGVGNIIIRIIVSLAMLTLITPLSGIPDAATVNNSYNKAIKEQGILFGTLQTLQDRVISQNILGKLILGIDVDDSDVSTSNTLLQSQQMINTIVKSFVQLNIDDDGDWVCDGNYEDDNTYKSYEQGSYAEIIDAANIPCKEKGSSKYKFSYIWGFSWIIGIAFIFIVAGFCVDIAVRMIKLLVLRIIAPIPIISYIDPKSDKDGAFGAWTKMLTKTYLDLFIRLMIIYFVMFIAYNMIQMMNNDLIFKDGGVNGFINVLSIVIIWLGLFVFAKSSPKFFMDMLGIKGDSKGFFKGIGAIAGAGALFGGLVGSSITNTRTSWDENRARGRNVFRSGINALGSSFAGALGGAWVGGRAALTAQDHHASAIFRAQQQRNALRAAHSTLPGRIADNASALFFGSSLATADETTLRLNQEAFDSLKAYKTMLQEEAQKQNNIYGVLTANNYRAGSNMRSYADQGLQFNYASLVAAMNAKDDNGNFSMDVLDSNGNYVRQTFNVSDFNTNVMNDILDSQSENYRASNFNTTTGRFANQKLETQWRNTQHAVRSAGIRFSGSYDDIGGAIGAATRRMADMNTDSRHIARRANSQANGNHNR